MDLSSAVAMSFSEADIDKKLETSSLNKTSSNIVSKPPTLIQAPLNKTTGAATSLINRTTAENIIGTSGATTLMVLTTSTAGTANHNGSVGMVSSGNTGTLAVKTATTTGAMGGAKTIVVMPVSNNFAAGDGATAKRFKIE